MLEITLNIPDLSAEFQFFTSRSSGPGGQNVNKVNSKVELRFDIQNSILLTDDQKAILFQKLLAKISAEGILSIVSQRHRSQLSNKEDAVNKFYTIITKALKPEKRRKKTSPSKSSVEKRLNEKRIKAVIKQSRQKIED
jgi:ribosome-associated protein